MNVPEKQKRRFHTKPRFVLIFCALALLAAGFAGCKSGPSAADPALDPVAGANDALARMDNLNRQAHAGEIFADTETPETASIAIVRPTGNALTPDEQYILDMIKSSMNSNFIKFAQGRIDVVNITDDEEIYREIERSLSGSNDELSLTSRTAAKALLTGEIVKIPNTSPPRYNINLRVTTTEKSVSIASYNRIHSDIEVIEGIAVNRATEDILAQLNVRLNEAGKQALYASTNSNQGDMDLAKGLNAAKSGQNLEAMNYLFSASSFDTTASQAADTLAAVQTRNEQDLQGAGDIVTDFFKSAELWQGRIDEYNTFYKNHLPFELYYTKVSPTNMLRRGASRTYDLEFNLGLRWNQNQLDVMTDVLHEYILEELGKIRSENPVAFGNYGLTDLPEEADLFRGRDNLPFELQIQVENENGAVIVSGPVTLSASLYWHQEKIYADCLQATTAAFRNIAYEESEITPNLYVRITSINGMNIQTAGENGFMRVSQMEEGAALPRVQPSQMPYSLQSAVKQEIADEEMARRIAALKNHYGTYIVGGGSFTPGAGFINFGLEGLFKMALVDVGVVHYFGAGGKIKHTDSALGTVGTEIGLPDGYSRFNFGGSFGASYALRLLSDKWFVAFGLGGMVYHISVQESSTSSDTTYSTSKGLPDLYSKTAFIPYLKAQFDYPLGTIAHLRLGYQLGLFNAETAGIWFNKPDTEGQLGDYLMWHSIFGGFSLLL